MLSSQLCYVPETSSDDVTWHQQTTLLITAGNTKRCLWSTPTFFWKTHFMQFSLGGAMTTSSQYYLIKWKIKFLSVNANKFRKSNLHYDRHRLLLTFCSMQAIKKECYIDCRKFIMLFKTIKLLSWLNLIINSQQVFFSSVYFDRSTYEFGIVKGEKYEWSHHSRWLDINYNIKVIDSLSCAS